MSAIVSLACFVVLQTLTVVLVTIRSRTTVEPLDRARALELLESRAGRRASRRREGRARTLSSRTGERDLSLDALVGNSRS
jgi:hypothetical protein